MASPARSLLPIEYLRTSGHPKERLDLLERVQGKSDWLASVVADTPDGKQELTALKTELDKKSYASYLDIDYHGNEVLRVHHVGRDTDIGNGIGKLGLLRGLRHAVENVTEPVGSAVKAGAHYAKYTADDPARLLAGLYIAGDVFYAGAGKSFSDPKEVLLSLSGIVTMLQSFILVAYAKDPSEYHLENVKKTMEQALKEGVSPVDPALWQSTHTPPTGTINAVDHLLKKHPVEAGSLAQIGSQLCLIAAGGLSLKDSGGKKGWGNILRACSSITGWTMLMAHEKSCDHKTDWRVNPLSRISEEFHEKPSHFASSFAILASLIGLYAAHEGLNPNQAMGEVLYLAGDATMHFVKREDMSSGDSLHTETAAKVAAEFMRNSPVLFCESTQTAFVHQLSAYLAERIVEERMEDRHKDPKGETEAMVAEETAAIAKDLAKNIFKELAGKERKSEKVANTLARLIELFPEGDRGTVEKNLIHAIAGLPGVSLDENDMHRAVQAERARFTLHAEAPASRPSMATLSTMLSELTFQLPSMNAAANAGALFEAILPHTRGLAGQEKLFEHALMRQATMDTGISPHMAASLVSPATESVGRY